MLTVLYYAKERAGLDKNSIQVNSCKQLLLFVYTNNAIISLCTITGQHSLLSFGFFIYHVFMQINKFAIRC